jgi:GT2 family glycosyltransferase
VTAFVPVHVGELELELEGGVEGLDTPVRGDGGRYERARLLVRSHGVPLGFVNVALEDGRADAEVLRAAVDRELGDAVRAHLDPDEACHATSSSDLPDVSASVVVCTKDPGDSLRVTLESLLAQSVAPTELLVIDNASTTDAAERIVGELPADRVRRVVEPIAGLSRARNRGLAEAHGEIVAFTDDDVRVDSEWLRGLLVGFTRAPRVGCVTGMAPAAELETPAQAFFDERLKWSGVFDQRLFDLGANRPDDRFFPYGAGTFGTGANFALRRSAAVEIGGFDEALGMGTPAETGEDLDFFLRIIQAGWTLAYEPCAIGWHCHRRDKAALRRQMYTYGVGLSAYAFKHARRPRHAMRIAARLPAALLRLSRDAGGAEREGHMTGAAASELRGLLAGPAQYARARRELRGRAAVAGLSGLDGFVPVHVGEVEMSRPVEGVDAPARYERARLLVRCHGVPLGFVTVGLEDGRADGEAVRAAVDGELGDAVRAHLEADEREGPAAAGPPDTSASVVVCTRDPGESLRVTLQSLLAQEVAPIEVIVADNGSTTDAAERIVDAIDDGRVRLVTEPIPGLSRARNRVLAEARGEIVAFTDDDVRVDAGWLRNLLLGFSRAPRVGCVTGVVAAAELETPAQAFLDERLSWSAAFEPRLYDLGPNRPDDLFFPYSAGAFGTGANHAVRRSVAMELGGYDEALGPGTIAPAGEELDFFLRLIQAGWTLAYEPGAVVWHDHRRDMAALRRQMYTYGVGLSAYAFKHARRPRAALEIAFRTPPALARLSRDAFRAERSARTAGLMAAELRGLLRGPSRYLRARRELRGRPSFVRADT